MKPSKPNYYITTRAAADTCIPAVLRDGDVVYFSDTKEFAIYSYIRQAFIYVNSRRDLERFVPLEENRPQVAAPTNCKNCGAPLHGRKCEYCDTEY